MRHWRGIIASWTLHAAAIGIVSAGVLPARESPVEDVPAIAVELVPDIESSPVMPSEASSAAKAKKAEIEAPTPDMRDEPLSPPTPPAAMQPERDVTPELRQIPDVVPEIFAKQPEVTPPIAEKAEVPPPLPIKTEAPPQPPTRLVKKKLKPKPDKVVAKTSDKVGKKMKQKAALASGRGSTGKTRSTDGAASDASFKSEVLARLRSAKRYPDAARKKGMEGVAVLSFTISASGRVTSARIVKGSGYALLDQATLAMARNAQPFPAIPASFARSQMTFRVPVQFNID